MSKRLYRVELTQTIYIMAASEREAEMDAASAASDDMGDPEAMAFEVKALVDVPHVLRDSLVHGAEGDVTVAQAIEMGGAK